MGDKLRMELESGQNPFKFQQYDKLDTIAEATTPLVIIASPGMLQNGPSRELFVKWAPFEENGVIFTGYSVEGSLAKKVIDSDKTIVVGDQIINREMSVNYESFSAHADFIATREYIDFLQPPNIVLVHGDQVEMGKLRDELQGIYQNNIQIMTPRNCQLVRFKLDSKKAAKVIGNLAKKVIKQTNLVRDRITNDNVNEIPQQLPAIQAQADVQMIQTEESKQEENDNDKLMQDDDELSNYVTVDGIIIKQDFDHLIMEENEVDKYTPLQSATMSQTLYVPFEHDIQVLGYFLHSYYALVESYFPTEEEA